MALRRLDLTAPEPDYPTPAFQDLVASPPPAPANDAPPELAESLTIRQGEDVADYFDRAAPLLAMMQVRSGAAGDGKAARWILEQTAAARDRISTTLDVTHEDLATAEGVSRTMRKVTVMALRGELGLTEARRATDLVKESSESMFADEIATLRGAIENAKRYSNRSLRAVDAEHMSRGAITVEEVDGVDASMIDVSPPEPALPAPRVVDVSRELDAVHDDAPTPTWGRFAGRAGDP